MARNTPITPPRIHIRLRWKSPGIFRSLSTNRVPPAHRADGQHDHQQRQTVNGEMDRDTKRGIHGMSNSDCHCGIPADCAVNNRPATTVAATAPASIPWYQRDPARHLDAKAFGLPAQEPPIKGINISQGSNMAIFIPLKVPSGPDFQRILTTENSLRLGVVSDAPRRRLIRPTFLYARGNPTILNSTQYHQQSQHHAAPMLMDATYQRR